MKNLISILESLLIPNEEDQPVDPVLDFIHRRFSKDCDWTNGNCYWFAKILQERFPGGVIIHEPIEGHFLYYYKNTYYDWNGVYKGDVSKATDFTEEVGSSWFHSLVRDCIL